MKHPYGYISRTEGADGDEVDVFLGPNEQADKVYVVHTKEINSQSFSEDKLFIGFNGADDAIDAFFANYDAKAKQLLAGIETIPLSELRDRLNQFRGRKIEAYV
jgi:hypothetical protein